MDNIKIAIVTFFHTEASLCLAKYIAKQGVRVDCYIIADIHHDKGSMPGVDYRRAPRVPGIVKLTLKTAPELVSDSQGIPVNYFIIRLMSFSTSFEFFNKIILRRVIKRIKSQGYDAIDIVGQWPLISLLHTGLKGENITHTFHEIGNHQTNEPSTPLLDLVIKDRSKVILLSQATKERFENIPGAKACPSIITPMGCFYTLLLYQKDLQLETGLDLRKPTFLFYGYLRSYKGLDMFERACRKLEDIENEFNIIIAGAGHDSSLAFFRSRNNCFVLNRFLSDSEMLYLNKISHVVVLPYKTASQSGIIPTSFMFGNPIIATNVGALAEPITNGINGYVVAPDDEAQFASAMRKVIENPKILEELRHGASQFGHGDMYDWNIIARNTIDFLMQK